MYIFAGYGSGLTFPRCALNMLDKEEKYRELFPVVQALMSGEDDEISCMANLSSLLHNEFGFWWTGFYRVSHSGNLDLGPFQGPLACTKIAFGKGVCGTAWKEQRTIIVPDVEKFPGHIACSSESRSEIVVPVWRDREIVAVLDIDSRELGTFDRIDAEWLERFVDCLYGSERCIWFAAGCFWGAQKFFKMVEGVTSTKVGFANGTTSSPSYKEVYTDTTGHAECVRVSYNPSVITLAELTGLYFKIIDPLSLNRQGEDEGTRYRTGVYYNDERDLDVLTAVFDRVKSELGVTGMPVELMRLKCFYPAEEYHQNYLDKNPTGYCHLSPAIFKLARRTSQKAE